MLAQLAAWRSETRLPAHRCKNRAAEPRGPAARARHCAVEALTEPPAEAAVLSDPPDWVAVVTPAAAFVV